jgi:replication factor C subunit 2/4
MGANHLLDLGYGTLDFITTLYKVSRDCDSMCEFLKLEFLREIGFVYMRLENGMLNDLQLNGLLAKLCKVVKKCNL